MVARINRLPESELENFLFGTERISNVRIRRGLWEIQNGRCFYCNDGIAEPHLGEVDHFLPRSRYPDDGIDNLVIAHKPCNRDKTDFLAAADHVENWSRRWESDFSIRSDLIALSQDTNWERAPEKTRSAARALYLRLPPDAILWQNARHFVPPDFPRLRAALCPEV